MSEASRKRSRKSKLVPRVCTIESEDDDDLQPPVYRPPKTVKEFRESKLKIQNQPTSTLTTDKLQCNILKKIPEPSKENEETDAGSPLKFNIKVEVEKFDDFKINNEGDNANSIQQSDVEASGPKITVTYIKKDTTNNENVVYTLTENKILEAADEIMQSSNSVADKILDTCVRNTIGHGQKGNLYCGTHESKIQGALNEWRCWRYRSYHRGSPLFYKCYLCEKSWWYLSEFREHIAEHNEINISLELHERHEANIIAYGITAPQVKDIYTEGVCYRCGKDFDAHKLISRIGYKYYGSPGCTKQFFTCSGLIYHFASCNQCEVKDKNVVCGICKNQFYTEGLLMQHLQISHTVRSDMPISVHYNVCRICCARYCCYYRHFCGRKGPHVNGCMYCFRSFSNKISIEYHMERASEKFVCEICNSVQPWSCMKYQHMMKHTDKYMLVWKCVQCDEMKVFTDSKAALHHRALDHNSSKDARYLSYFIRILIPKSCIQTSLPERVGKLEDLMEPELAPTMDCPQQIVPMAELPTELVKVKEEPKDFEADIAASYIAIKQEPNDTISEFTIEEPASNMYIPEVNIKQEYENEEEYEDDIIKLDFNIHDHFMVKQELDYNESQELINETFESADKSMETSNEEEYQPIQRRKKDSNLETKINSKRKIKKLCKYGVTGKLKENREHIQDDCSSIALKPKVCTKCSQSFLTMKKYLEHFVQHGFNIHACPQCLKQYYTFSDLSPHIQSHIKKCFVRVKFITTEGTKSRSQYQCRKCSKFVKFYDFFDHWETHVEGNPNLVINKESTQEQRISSQITNESVERLLVHLQKQPKQCCLCNRHFNRINECKRHLIEHLLSDAYTHKIIYTDLRCQQCGSGFPTAERYKFHMRDHASLPVYTCQICDRSFSDSSNFTKHKKVHNIKVFVCDLCGKKFQSKLSLEKHIEAHRTNTPIKCKLCTKIFHFQSAFRRHMRYTHKANNKGFGCAMCNQRFPSLKLKWDHLWEVHKERHTKADCPICFKSFRKYIDVRNHAKTVHHTELSVFSVKHSRNINGNNVGNMIQNNSDLKICEDSDSDTLVILE